MITKSLSFRLFTTSVTWVLMALTVVGVLLILMFQHHIEEHFDAFLYDHLEENIAAAIIDNTGELYLTWVPADRRFSEPYSGWYWQINQNKKLIAVSESLVDGRLEFKPPDAASGARVVKALGPHNEKLRIVVQQVVVPGSDFTYTFSVAGTVAGINRDVMKFTTKLVITLMLLGAGLISAVFMQIRIGLKPLRLMKSELRDIRSGMQKRLPEDFPSEVLPIVRELNSMMGHSEALLDRARTQVGDLAHALKNPMTVIRNEAHEIEGERGKLLAEKIDAMAAYIERYLSRARAAGSVNVIGASVDVQAIVRDISYLMVHTYQDDGINIRLRQLEGLYFKGDAQDLEEMIGNLLDNACKWANTEVIVYGNATRNSRIIICIEDDGPGIPRHQRENVLKRGQRLDETVPGSGLGLGIVSDIAALYQGSLTLERSSAGGLLARLELPAAE
jgi:signal transduction histidine kinase